jgi:hypothetical protein
MSEPQRDARAIEDWDEPYAQGCWRCGGEGWIVICIDDMCRGAGECIHGDGETLCPECGGEGLTLAGILSA